MSQNADQTANSGKAYPLSRLVFPSALLITIAVSYGQIATGLGKSPEEFAADGDATLQAAPFAFSIWAVIYIWLAVFAVFQALPRDTEPVGVKRLRWPLTASVLGAGLWVMVAAADAKWLSVIVLFATAAAIIVPMALAPGPLRAAALAQRALTSWPAALFAGWLTIAAVLNLITVATATETLPTFAEPFVWAVIGLAAIVALALGIAARLRLWLYPVPIAWGLVGVFSAEQAEGDNLLAILALCAAFALAILAALLWAGAWKPKVDLSDKRKKDTPPTEPAPSETADERNP